MHRTCKRCVTTNFFFTHQQQQKGVCVFRAWTQLQGARPTPFQLCPTVFESSTMFWFGSARCGPPEVGVAWHYTWAPVKVSADSCLGFVRCCVRELTTSRRTREVSPTDPELKSWTEDLRRLRCSAWLSLFDLFFMMQRIKYKLYQASFLKNKIKSRPNSAFFFIVAQK